MTFLLADWQVGVLPGPQLFRGQCPGLEPGSAPLCPGGLAAHGSFCSSEDVGTVSSVLGAGLCVSEGENVFSGDKTGAPGQGLGSRGKARR